MTKSIDEWTAEKCGVLFPQHDDMNRWAMPNAQDWNKGKWTIKDPRCREIFRNWWLQGSPTDKPRSVRFDTDKVYYGEWDEIGCKMLFSGDDEEDCITAIYEARIRDSIQNNGIGG